MTVEQLQQLQQAASGRHDPCAMCDGSGPWEAPWAVEDDIKGDGHWDNEFHVLTEGGNGSFLATFQYRPHAEFFAAVVNALPALLDIAEAADLVAVDASDDGSGLPAAIEDPNIAELAAALSRLEGATDVD